MMVTDCSTVHPWFMISAMKGMRRNMATGLIFNIQRYSLQDGPGIRSTVFLKGCPLSCRWCHNPEGISSRPEILFTRLRCIRCGLCVEACPKGAPETGLLERCSVCGRCVSACPTGARELAGQETTVPALLAEVSKDRVFYEESQGGVTFSGGEPLLQTEFLLECLRACREQGLHTAVDTCGYGPAEKLLALAAVTDLFLYDLKILDDSLHRQYTGVSVVPIQENLRALSRAHDNIWIRLPIIPGFNDAPEQVAAMGRFIVSLGVVRRVNLLPYHAMAAGKFARMGREFLMNGTPAPTAGQIEQAAAPLRALGLPVVTGG